MIKQFIIKLISPIVKETIQDLIQIEHKSLYREFEVIRAQSSDDIFHMIKTFGTQMTKFSLRISYVYDGLTQTHVYSSKTLNEFKTLLMNFEPEYDELCGCSLYVEFNHPKLGEQTEYEIFINTLDNNIYNSSEVTKICNSILEFIDTVPELII